MTNLYLITGPAGVGKTTLSKCLASKLNKSALIEGDDIYHQVVGGYNAPWSSDNHLDIFWRICLNNIKIYLDNEYDVVFNYIIDKNNLEDIKDYFNDYNIKFVVLMADEDTILKRDKSRDIEDRMNERCILLLNEFKKYNYDDKYIIDTTKISIDDRINMIINEDRFLL